MVVESPPSICLVFSISQVLLNVTLYLCNRAQNKNIEQKMYSLWQKKMRYGNMTGGRLCKSALSFLCLPSPCVLHERNEWNACSTCDKIWRSHMKGAVTQRQMICISLSLALLGSVNLGFLKYFDVG